MLVREILLNFAQMGSLRNMRCDLSITVAPSLKQGFRCGPALCTVACSGILLVRHVTCELNHDVIYPVQVAVRPPRLQRSDRRHDEEKDLHCRCEPALCAAQAWPPIVTARTSATDGVKQRFPPYSDPLKYNLAHLAPLC